MSVLCLATLYTIIARLYQLLITQWQLPTAASRFANAAITFERANDLMAVVTGPV